MYASLHYLASFSVLSRQALLERLTAAGIQLDPDKAAHTPPALVFANTIDTHLVEHLQDLRAQHVDRTLVVCALPQPDPQQLWSLLRAGATDVLCWQNSAAPEKLIAERLLRWQRIDALLAAEQCDTGLIGADPAWIATLRRLVELAHFTDAAILILGETGTGKELAARLVHRLDARPRKKDFVILDCASLVPELSGSEFFGHERGSFTHAVQAREGALELADNGTLFLDELGELPLALQAQLLRAVQERSYKRVGGNLWRSSAFRLICATHRDLQDDVRQGRFRQDLYYRVATHIVRLPPLRERRQDILPLARHCMAELNPDQPGLEFDNAVRDYLLAREYPGNVRELRQVVMRLLSRHVGSGPLTLGAIPDDERPLPATADDWSDAAFEQSIRKALSAGVRLKEIGRAAEDAAIRIAVSDENGNLQRAALRLGVTDRALQLRRANVRTSQRASH